MLEANPELTPGDVRTILEWTAREDDDTGDLPVTGDLVWGHGKVTASQAVLAAIGWVAGTEESAAPSLKVSLYPNPATNHIWVITPDWNQGHWQLMDVQGKALRAGTLANTFSVDLKGLPDGAYLLRMDCDGQPSMFKRVIKHSQNSH